MSLFDLVPPLETNPVSLEDERLKLKKLQRKYRKATHNLSQAVKVAQGSGVPAAMRKNVRLQNLRSAIQNLIDAEADNNGKEFHRWFFVMARAYEELENYLQEDEDETRGSP
jgi:type I restriction-modification system DNA methylase subunit